VADALPLQDGAFYLSRISINHETSAGTGPGLPMLQMAIPVREHVGPALGVVVVNVDLNGLFRLLAADLPEDYQLYLANGAGDILIHPDASRALPSTAASGPCCRTNSPRSHRCSAETGRVP
jgi:hypothetical protein